MRYRRSLVVATLLALGVTLSGCESFDPTEWFNTKKPLPGDRKAVFPSGVPGVPQGVPPELVEGYQPPPEPPPQLAETPPEPPKPKPKAQSKPKPKQAAARPLPAAAPQPQSQAASQAPSQTPWPAPGAPAAEPVVNSTIGPSPLTSRAARPSRRHETPMRDDTLTKDRLCTGLGPCSSRAAMWLGVE